VWLGFLGHRKREIQMILRNEHTGSMMNNSFRLANSNWRKHTVRSLVLVAILTAGLSADEDSSKRCSNVTIKGSYGYTLAGTRPVPGGYTGQRENFLGVGVRHFDGQGNFRQVDSYKGEVAGARADVAASGTYVINPDCTGTGYLNPPRSNIVVEQRLVVMDNGKEIRWFVLTPQATMVSGHAVRQ
jgi:hypothetical protein